MKKDILVFDFTITDKLSQVRGVGRYLQILKENFPRWTFGNKLHASSSTFPVFINPFFNFLQPPVTLRRLAKKQIAVIHDLIPLKYPKHFPSGIKGKIRIFLNKLALKNYDLIITDSQASKKDIIKMLHVDEKKINVIYPCLPKIFLEKSPITNHQSQINSKNLELANSNLFRTWNLELGAFCLYVGDATWNKNLVNLARAIKIINVTCVFVGKVFEEIKKLSNKVIKDKENPNYSITHSLNFSHPWQKEFKEFLKEAENDKRFIFLGFVDDSRLIKLYQQAKVNVLPSRDEGFGFSYLEAASQGCPSVLGDIPVLREIADGSAWFANSEDPYDLANKIGEIYFNKKLKDQLGFKAWKRAKLFNQDVFKKRLQSVLK